MKVKVNSKQRPPVSQEFFKSCCKTNCAKHKEKKYPIKKSQNFGLSSLKNVSLYIQGPFYHPQKWLWNFSSLFQKLAQKRSCVSQDVYKSKSGVETKASSKPRVL